jgi:Mg2+-importing ATPase
MVTLGVVLPYTGLGHWFGFVPLPPTFLLALAAIVVCYLLLAEGVKRWFYRRQPPRGVMRAPSVRPHLPLVER